MSTKDNVIDGDCIRGESLRSKTKLVTEGKYMWDGVIRIGEKTAFIKAVDRLRKHKFVALIATSMLALSIIYILLLNKFFMLLKTI